MEIPKGMEEMVFSSAYYQVKDFDRILFFLKEFEKKGLFSIDDVNIKTQKLSGTFLMKYPKNHWNPFSKMPGAKQVIGGAEINDGSLKIDTKTKGGLKLLRELLENTLSNAIEFQKQEFEDIMEMLRKK